MSSSPPACSGTSLIPGARYVRAQRIGTLDRDVARGRDMDHRQAEERVEQYGRCDVVRDQAQLVGLFDTEASATNVADELDAGA